MKTAFVLALVLATLGAAMAADEVRLVLIRNVQSCPYGQCYQINYFVVDVANIAYVKSVRVHYQKPNGIWTDFPLTWRESANNGARDIFDGSFTLGSADMGDLKVAVNYTVSGTSYWDNNGGFGINYLSAANTGDSLVNGNVIYAGEAQPAQSFSRSANNVTGYASIFVPVVVKNNAYTKNVKIDYQFNNQGAYTEAACTFSAQEWIGWYSSAANPNSQGYERWECSIPAPVGTGLVKYFSKVNFNGGDWFIDNFYGYNYPITITWTA